MQTRFGHIQFNVQPANLSFYKELITFLGWPVIMEGDDFFGVGGPTGDSLWFIGYVKPVSNDYDGPGMNHIALAAASQADVDAVVAYLADRGVPALEEMASREWLARQSGWRARANAAQANCFEAIPFYIGAVIIQGLLIMVGFIFCCIGAPIVAFFTVFTPFFAVEGGRLVVE